MGGKTINLKNCFSFFILSFFVSYSFCNAYVNKLTVGKDRQHASLAQSVEHRTFNPGVTGSNPVGRTKYALLAQLE